MKTVIISDLNNLSEAAKLIQEGKLVASPTETVYGLCADALNPEAVSTIYKAKGRPSDNPLIVHIADLDMLKPLVKEIPERALPIINAFWPGPLTLVFKASALVPKIVTGGLDTVAVRFPSHPIMKAFIKASQRPIAAPSANTSGKPSPTNAKRVYDDLNGKISAIIDGGSCEFGVESTVLDITSEVPTILRPGGITQEMLEEVVPFVNIDPAIGHLLAEGEKPKAPGMKYKHYAPNANVYIVQGETQKVAAKINQLVTKGHEEHQKIGVLCTDETKDLFHADLILSAGTESNLITIASHLFEILREFDDNHIDTVYSLSFPKTGIGSAIMNRLEKSAGYKIITL